MNTLLSVTGNRRGGDVELCYASFLSSGSVATRVLKHGVLKKKAQSGSFTKGWYEKWNDRHVTLRGNFICVGKVNHDAQAKLHMISSVSVTADNSFTVTSTTQGRLHFRTETQEEKESWVRTIRDALDHADSLPHMEDHKRNNSDIAALHVQRSGSSNGSDTPSATDSEELERSSSSAEVGAQREAIAPPGPSCVPPESVSRNAIHQVVVFWDTTTVRPDNNGESEERTKKVREFATQHGQVKTFNVYSEEQGSALSVRKRMDKDILIWLLDEAQSSATSTVILISDRAFLETLKELANRGIKVIVVNSRIDKTVSVSATASIEFTRSSHALWESSHSKGDSSRGSSAHNSPRGRRRNSEDSGSESPAENEVSGEVVSCAKKCQLEAKLQELDVVSKRPSAATLILVLANVLLAILLLWFA